MVSAYVVKILGALTGYLTMVGVSVHGAILITATNDQHLRVRIPSFRGHVGKMWTSDWVRKAADLLREEGAVILQIDDSECSSVIPPLLCDEVNEAIHGRIDDLKEKISLNGMDPSGRDGQYRFTEIISRDEGGNRFDVPVAWLADNVDDMMPYSPQQGNSIKRLHHKINNIVSPIALSLWDIQQERIGISSCGFLVNDPGSENQEYHRDGPDPGFLDVFVPLIDLCHEIGPTSLFPGSHISSDAASLELEPLLKKGECLIFDYRVLHRGQGNSSTNTRRTLAYVVYTNRGPEKDNKDFWNFPSSPTLKYY